MKLKITMKYKQLKQKTSKDKCLDRCILKARNKFKQNFFLKTELNIINVKHCIDTSKLYVIPCICVCNLSICIIFKSLFLGVKNLLYILNFSLFSLPIIPSTIPFAPRGLIFYQILFCRCVSNWRIKCPATS